MSTFTCSSCGHKGPLTELDPLTPDDLASLGNYVGSPVPAGLCPDCGTWCDVDGPDTVTLTLTVPERDTVLAALRFWQCATESRAKPGYVFPGMDQFLSCRDIAADNGEPLTAEQIDALCGRVNP